MCPSGAASVVLAEMEALTTSWVYQSRQMTRPCPGKMPVPEFRSGSERHASELLRPRILTVYSGDVWSENGRDEQVSPDKILAIDVEELRLVGEFEEERTDGRASVE